VKASSIGVLQVGSSSAAQLAGVAADTVLHSLVATRRLFMKRMSFFSSAEQPVHCNKRFETSSEIWAMHSI
jgi:hypothetical protein